MKLFEQYQIYNSLKKSNTPIKKGLSVTNSYFETNTHHIKRITSTAFCPDFSGKNSIKYTLEITYNDKKQVSFDGFYARMIFNLLQKKAKQAEK